MTKGVENSGGLGKFGKCNGITRISNRIHNNLDVMSW
jgi:hypothetical protein